MARITSTARRPSRPSTSGSRPDWIAATKSASWRAWPTCEMAAGLLDPPEAPLFCANRARIASSALVGERRGQPADVRHGAHHPQQQIDVVNRLVHQRPAAVERLRALPAAFIVVRLRPPPLARRLTEGEPAETALRDRVLEGTVGV